jgi:hypothetical protein
MRGSDKPKTQRQPSTDAGAKPATQSQQPIAIVTLENAAQVGHRVPMERIENDVLRQAHAIWSDRRGLRRFPARTDIAPRDMAAFLSNVTLFQIADQGEGFAYRIMGDAAVVAWGQSFRGMGRSELNALQPGMGDVVARVCRWVVREQEPLVMRGVLRKGIIDARCQETIFLPLGVDDGTVDHILSVGIYVPQSLEELTTIAVGPE